MRPVGVILLVILLSILALLGFMSGGFFLTDPSGGSHGMDTDILNGTPISDFLIVGVFFVIAYGILPLLSIIGLWKLPRWKWTDPVNKWTGMNWAWSLTVAIGVILIIWIVVEVAFIGSPEGTPRCLQGGMAFVGALIILLALLPGVRRYAKLRA
jgi:hypothetical protein